MSFQDMTDEEMEKKISDDVTQKLASIDPAYRDAVKATLTDILDAQKPKGKNHLFMQLGSVFTKNADNGIYLEQDYTQFTPRSHYTTNSLLKTYFMGMKYLMRHKFYYEDTDQAIASLILTKNMTSAQQRDFDQLYSFVKKLV